MVIRTGDTHGSEHPAMEPGVAARQGGELHNQYWLCVHAAGGHFYCGKGADISIVV